MKEVLACKTSAALLDKICRTTGLGVPVYRSEVVEVALLEVAKRHGLDGIEDLFDRVGADREMTDEMVSALTVGETYFFRDPEQLELMRNTFIPGLLRVLPPGQPIRIWCAGCSTGEEPYSVAIMMEQDGLGDRSQIVATDISGTALDVAKKAEYSAWSLRGTDTSLLSHFTKIGGRYRLDRRIGGRVDFVRHGLGRESRPFRSAAGVGFDLVLCRNVLMYMDPAAVERAARQLHDSLTDGGWLLTGPSDPPLWSLAPFETEANSSGIAYRRSGRRCMVVERPGSSGTGQPGRAANSPRNERRNNANRRPTTAYAQLQRLSRGAIVDSRTARVAELIKRGKANVAEAAVREAAVRHPLSAELHYLHGLTLMATGQRDAAVAALRRSIFLNRWLEAARFRMAVCLAKDSPEAALRELANARAICSARKSEEQVPLMEGMTARSFADRVEAEIARLQALIERLHR